MKKKSFFKKFAIIYFSILAILCGIFIYYVIDSLIMYENSAIEKYISNLVVDLSKSASRGKIDNYIDISNIKISNYETSNITINEAYKNIFSTKEITYELVESSKKDAPAYNILADKKILFTLTLKSAGDIHRMGLLSFPDWQIEKVSMPTDRGIYYYDISALDGYKVFVNKKEVKSTGKVQELDNELEELGKYSELPKIVTYEINNLTSEPEIKILDENNKEIDYTKEGNHINAYDLYKTDDIEQLNERLVSEVDVLEISEMWSKFLTDDLPGTYHGYSTIKQYLIDGTYLWDMAYEWSHGVDITFVSNHRLLGFENESVSNCTLYNNKAFSCEVYLEKNMTLGYGKPKKDIMHEKLYFAYYEGSWKLISMKAITEND